MQLSFLAIKTADNQKEMCQYLKQNNFYVLREFDIEKLKRLIGEIL